MLCLVLKLGKNVILIKKMSILQRTSLETPQPEMLDIAPPHRKKPPKRSARFTSEHTHTCTPFPHPHLASSGGIQSRAARNAIKTF